MASVFLSYDHDDVGIARPIAAALEKAGHTVWYDRHIHGGAQYSRKIEQELDSADTVVVLWSPRSLDSAWVRDEAAEGRDREKLVPLSVEGVTAPIGFRQFQTIALGNWSGRGKVPHLADLLHAIDSQSEVTTSPLPPRSSHGAEPATPPRRKWMLAPIAALALGLAGWAGWKLLAPGDLPVIAVQAGGSSPQSAAASSDLFVKLGSLEQINQGKWKLVDDAAAAKDATFVFRASDTGSSDKPQSNVVLLDGKDGSLLWSREFTGNAGSQADLRQQLALTSGRVLRCTLDSRAAELKRDIMKLYLNACAQLTEASYDEQAKGATLMRQVVTAKPDFLPAWGPLIWADLGALSASLSEPTGVPVELAKALDDDVAKAKAAFPDLPELALVQVHGLPPNDFAQNIALLEKAVAKAPDNSLMLTDLASAYQRVGRGDDAVGTARKAATLDPLSPVTQQQLILSLAYNGQLVAAREELAKAEKTWAGTGTLRDTEWAYHMRFGDPATALKYTEFADDAMLKIFFKTRLEPTSANIAAFASAVHNLEPHRTPGMFASAVQALGEFGLLDDILHWVAITPEQEVIANSYVFFRPPLAVLRRDPRFIEIARRTGLLAYWRKSGIWPDFCRNDTLLYDCKKEAAKYAG